MHTRARPHPCAWLSERSDPRGLDLHTRPRSLRASAVGVVTAPKVASAASVGPVTPPVTAVAVGQLFCSHDSHCSRCFFHTSMPGHRHGARGSW